MKIDVSDGEIVDKYSVLCLKLEKIIDPNKKEQVLHEQKLIQEYAVPLIDKNKMYYELLYHINKLIWEKTDDVKVLNLSKDPLKIARITMDIFNHNDQRFRLKRIFNMGSNVKEQKSYEEKTLRIWVPDTDALMKKLDEIIYMVSVYDKIQVSGDDKSVFGILPQWIPAGCISFGGNEEDMEDISKLYVSDDAPAISIIQRFTKKMM
jgi:hypothetical protein